MSSRVPSIAPSQLVKGREALARYVLVKEPCKVMKDTASPLEWFPKEPRREKQYTLRRCRRKRLHLCNFQALPMRQDQRSKGNSSLVQAIVRLVKDLKYGLTTSSNKNPSL